MARMIFHTSFWKILLKSVLVHIIISSLAKTLSFLLMPREILLGAVFIILPLLFIPGMSIILKNKNKWAKKSALLDETQN